MTPDGISKGSLAREAAVLYSWESVCACVCAVSASYAFSQGLLCRRGAPVANADLADCSVKVQCRTKFFSPL